MRVLLTSAGLETEELQDVFLRMAGKEPSAIRALFIPTAAIDADAVGVLPKCMNDLLKCGIPSENITVFDLHCSMESNTLLQYDVVYFCGGSTRYLLNRIRDTGFDQTLNEYIRSNGLVLGVSAGSLIFAENLPDNLGLFPARLDVHQETGTVPGILTPPIDGTIRLTNSGAIIIRDLPDQMEIIGN